jgi:hypothetical protein
MPLTSDGLDTVLDDGAAAIMWAAVGDGDTAGDEVSTTRVLIEWSTPTNGVLTAANTPLVFAGSPDGDATHLLVFDAETDGALLGVQPLQGDVVFNAAGEFEIAALTLTATPADAASTPVPPSAPFTLGTQVGVPTSASLTPTSGLPGVPDATETYVLTNPVTGESTELTVEVYEGRSWAATLQVGVSDPGRHLLFRNCLFDRTEGDPYYCVDIVDNVAAQDVLAPVAIFERCTFKGNGTTGGALAGNAVWVIECHLEGAADAWFGCGYSVAIRSNFLVENDNPEGHLDAIQQGEIGHLVVWNSWCDVGPGEQENTNAAIRAATDFGSIDQVWIYYCGLAGGGYTVQIRSGGTYTVGGVRLVGNRWVNNSRFGPLDTDEGVTITLYTDNEFFTGGEVPSP